MGSGGNNTDNCPTILLLNLLGKKWMLLILYELYQHTSMSFSQLQKNLHPINSRILTERLDNGVDSGLIIRDVSTTKPIKIRYSLSDYGKRIAPIIDQLCQINPT